MELFVTRRFRFCASHKLYNNGWSKEKNIKVINDSRPFNFSQLNNDAVKKANGNYVLFLNNDIEVITKGWLKEMLSIFQQKDVGAVGARRSREDCQLH